MGSKLDKELILKGNSPPVTKDEINSLFGKEDAMCKIFSTTIVNKQIKPSKGTGFFLHIDNENIPFHNCLMTNNHVLEEKDTEKNNKIYIEYRNKEKIIEMTEKRRVITNKELDYTCIEILKEDKIKQYFEIEKNIGNNNYSYLNQDIFVFQYPNGESLSYSCGKIKAINDKTIKHTASTLGGSSGSPIISRYSNLSVIGLHCGGYFNKDYNLSSTISSILNDLKKYNNNIILSEIDIQKFQVNKKTLIINSDKEKFGKITGKFENEKNNCKIEIDGEIIPFCDYYKFKEKGKHIIKYYF